MWFEVSDLWTLGGDEILCWIISNKIVLEGTFLKGDYHVMARDGISRCLYLIAPFWYTSAAYQASLVEPWIVCETQSSHNTHGESERA